MHLAVVLHQVRGEIHKVLRRFLVYKRCKWLRYSTTCTKSFSDSYEKSLHSITTGDCRASKVTTAPFWPNFRLLVTTGRRYNGLNILRLATLILRIHLAHWRRNGFFSFCRQTPQETRSVWRWWNIESCPSGVFPSIALIHARFYVFE